MKIKDLDRSKVYDLSDLNKKQRKALYDWLVKNDVNWSDVPKSEFVKKSNDFLIYDGVEWDWVTEANIDKKQVITNALELFKEEEPIFEEKQELMDIEVDFEKIEVKKDDNKESESSLRYKEYIDLGFEREDINDQVRFNQSGYFGYILIKKLKKGLEIQVTDCSLNEPKLYLKHDFVLALSKQQVMALCR